MYMCAREKPKLLFWVFVFMFLIKFFSRGLAYGGEISGFIFSQNFFCICSIYQNYFVNYIFLFILLKYRILFFKLCVYLKKSNNFTKSLMK